MENSLFLAKLLGPYLAVIALAFLLNLESHHKVTDEFCKSPALIYLGGLFALLFGLLVVLTHNLWIAGWQVIITVLGWLSLVKGAWLILAPDTVAKFAKIYRKKTTLLTVKLAILLALGVFLTAKGYGLTLR